MSDNSTQNAGNPWMLGDRAYDFVRKLVQIILPALGSFYFSLAGLWDLPEPDKVVGTIVVVTTFLGIVLGISKAQYTASGKGIDGNLVVAPTAEGPVVQRLVYDGVAEDLQGKSTVTFKIQEIAQTSLEEEFDPVIPKASAKPVNPRTRKRKPTS